MRTIAVLPFRNATGSADFDVVARNTPDFVVALAGPVEGIAFVERERIGKLYKELRLGARGDQDAAGMLRLGKMVGAECVLGGSVARDGETDLVVNAHLYDVESTRILQSFAARGRTENLTSVFTTLSSNLLVSAGTRIAPPSPKQIDHSPEANLHFMRGLGYYHANVPEKAVAEFTKALAHDPGHVSARYWNMRAYLRLGDTGHARIEYSRFTRDAPDDPRHSDIAVHFKGAAEGAP